MSMDIARTGQSASKGIESLRALGTTGQTRFTDVFSAKLKEVTFSAHAQTRMKSRNISMTPQMMDSLNRAVSGAAQKGSRDSLVLMSNLAFIVHVPDRTVITAMDRESVKDNIFTNIDSAVLADA